ncbi:D-aminoacyl-tRNA deacylase [Tessaracoccus antarcticus]|uniref:D-aminoacyl-tRNA deacylase n=1 Tax=Tessaracoccus antarcticus TaxID=2479848 RepID=A0A3M0G889_9ACTN|nr:D-aminoacyl-tRNA deacylase [Tessaracoccus antarcticus]RMB61124.1 D-tyrosyl-tRNA(Tyr) deacylase [Tessaracoccus antarcticus]
MRVVITRVAEASVTVDGDLVSQLPRPGLLVLVGIARGDGPQDARAVAAKTWSLRILRDERSASDTNAPILVISQFTLHAATRRGRRPSWSAAASGDVSEPLVELFCRELEALGAEVGRGRFGAEMQVASVNDGPITILIDTQDWR